MENKNAKKHKIHADEILLIVQIVFIILKLTKVITWKWSTVFIPSLGFIVLLVIMFILILTDPKDIRGKHNDTDL